MQLVVVYVLGAYLEDSGSLRFLSNWFISRKIGEGRPWVFTFLILLAAFILSSLVSVFFTIIIMWGIFYEVCKVVGLEQRSKYVNMVLIGIVVIAGLSGALFPFKPFSLMIIGLMEKGVGAPIPINFVSWTVFNLLLSLGFTIFFMLVGRFIVRPDMTKVKEAGKAFAYLRDDKMDHAQKLSAGIFMLFLIMLIIPSFFSKDIPFVAWLSNAGVLGATGVCLILLYLLKNKDWYFSVFLSDDCIPHPRGLQQCCPHLRQHGMDHLLSGFLLEGNRYRYCFRRINQDWCSPWADDFLIKNRG